MPEPLHPPYNILQPRTLVRWLDINSQNGPLTRSQYYFTIPAYDIAFVNVREITGPYSGSYASGYTKVQTVDQINTGAYLLWYPGNSVVCAPTLDGNGNPVGTKHYPTIIDGQLLPSIVYQDFDPLVPIHFTNFAPASFIGTFSDVQMFVIAPRICGAFDYIMLDTDGKPRSFSLQNFIQIPLPLGSGTITISYIDKHTNVTRYMLGSDAAHPIFGNIPLYTNQRIKSIFRIEIWGSGSIWPFRTPNANQDLILSTPLKLYTSIRTNQDYRYNSDNNINPSPIVTNFSTPNLNLPFMFPNVPQSN